MKKLIFFAIALFAILPFLLGRKETYTLSFEQQSASDVQMSLLPSYSTVVDVKPLTGVSEELEREFGLVFAVKGISPSIQTVSIVNVTAKSPDATATNWSISSDPINVSGGIAVLPRMSEDLFLNAETRIEATIQLCGQSCKQVVVVGGLDVNLEQNLGLMFLWMMQSV